MSWTTRGDKHLQGQCPLYLILFKRIFLLSKSTLEISYCVTCRHCFQSLVRFSFRFRDICRVLCCFKQKCRPNTDWQKSIWTAGLLMSELIERFAIRNCDSGVNYLRNNYPTVCEKLYSSLMTYSWGSKYIGFRNMMDSARSSRPSIISAQLLQDKDFLGVSSF